MQVGTDANSQLLKDSLTKCGVDLSYLREIEGPSGTAMIMVDPSGTFCLLMQHMICILPTACMTATAFDKHAPLASRAMLEVTLKLTGML